MTAQIIPFPIIPRPIPRDPRPLDRNLYLMLREQCGSGAEAERATRKLMDQLSARPVVLPPCPYHRSSAAEAAVMAVMAADCGEGEI